jgi:hypothetical protein
LAKNNLLPSDKRIHQGVFVSAGWEGGELLAGSPADKLSPPPLPDRRAFLLPTVVVLARYARALRPLARTAHRLHGARRPSPELG